MELKRSLPRITRYSNSVLVWSIPTVRFLFNQFNSVYQIKSKVTCKRLIGKKTTTPKHLFVRLGNCSTASGFAKPCLSKKQGKAWAEIPVILTVFLITVSPHVSHLVFCSEGGVFKAELQFPQNYPNSPPKMRFVTEMWHPNSTYSFLSLLLVT